LLSRLFKPLRRRRVVNRHASTFIVRACCGKLRSDVPALGGPQPPRERRLQGLGQAPVRAAVIICLARSLGAMTALYRICELPCVAACASLGAALLLLRACRCCGGKGLGECEIERIARFQITT
jgi:hypothetical protein